MKAQIESSQRRQRHTEKSVRWCSINGHVGMIFDGHGDGSNFYLSDGNVRNGGIYTNKETRRISAEEIAAAIIKRSHNGLSTKEKPDLYFCILYQY